MNELMTLVCSVLIRKHVYYANILDGVGIAKLLPLSGFKENGMELVELSSINKN